ncbi:MAG: HAMP domain-containing histidine kinase [Deltaproteobacteria bacterium]|nr:HAMP domain-containing histidine kinase [Deltaproteobacteria bacterium]
MTRNDRAPDDVEILALVDDPDGVVARATAGLGRLRLSTRVPASLGRTGAASPVVVVRWRAGDGQRELRRRLRAAPSDLVVVGLCDGPDEADFWAAARELTALAATAPHPPEEAGLARALRSALAVRAASKRADAAREHADAELAKVLYAVSHDLRAPTQGLVGLAGLLAETEGARLSPDGREVCAEMERSGQRLSRMVDALAICSRLDRRVAVMAEVPLQPMVEHLFAQAIQTHQTRFPRLSLDPALPAIVSDGDLLSMILQQLIDNAIRYNRSSPPRIHVGCDVTEDRVELTVVDNGLGLTADQQAAAFELFTCLHPRESDGVGAGLTIAQKAAARLGGEVRCQSEPGEGSSFTVSLPARSVDAG